MNNIIDFININRDRYVDELKAYLAIPSISALPEHAADVRRCAEWTRRRDAPHRPAERPADRDARQSRRLRRLARRPGRADDPVLRALRRAAGRSARAVGVAAVRGDRSRRRDLRARRGRRQGPGLHALQGHRGAPEAERHAAVQHQDHSRGRGGSRAARTSTTSSASTRTSSPPTSSSSPTRAMFDRGVPSICYGLRGLVYFQIDLRGTQDRPALGVVRRRGREPGVRARADPRADEGPRRPHQDPRLLRRRAGAAGRRSGSSGSALPFNEKQYRKELGAPKLFGESGYTTLERMWARPTFEVNGLLSGFTGEGAKTVIPAVAMAKVSMRLVPDQDPDKIAKLFEAYVQKIAPKTVEREGHAHARRQAVDDRVRQPVRAGGRPRDREGLRQGAGVHPRRRIDSGRLDVPGRARRCRRCCSASACRTRTRTRRTRSSISATSTTASSRRRTCTRRLARSPEPIAAIPTARLRRRAEAPARVLRPAADAAARSVCAVRLGSDELPRGAAQARGRAGGASPHPRAHPRLDLEDAAARSSTRRPGWRGRISTSACGRSVPAPMSFRRRPDLAKALAGSVLAARRALRNLPQVGAPGRGRMLLFAGDAPVIPVDPVTARVTVRLGLCDVGSRRAARVAAGAARARRHRPAGRSRRDAAWCSCSSTTGSRPARSTIRTAACARSPTCARSPRRGRPETAGSGGRALRAAPRGAPPTTSRSTSIVTPEMSVVTKSASASAEAG